jgi:hypothetical protein
MLTREQIILALVAAVAIWFFVLKTPKQQLTELQKREGDCYDDDDCRGGQTCAKNAFGPGSKYGQCQSTVGPGGIMRIGPGPSINPAAWHNKRNAGIHPAACDNEPIVGPGGTRQF